MTFVPRRLLAASALAAVSSFAAPRAAHATSYVMMSDAALADQAAVVVDARVVDAVAAPEWGRAPAIDYEVAVERVLKGSAPGVLVVRVPGGIDPSTGLGLQLFGAPRFAAGEETLLFLRPAGDGTFRILHLMLGAFHRRALAGHTVALRDLSEAHPVELPGHEPAGADDLRDFAGFSSWLEDRALGIERPRGYLLGKAPAGLEGTAKELGSASAAFTYLLPGDGYPIRWFAFDRGERLAWSIHAGGQPGLGEAATAAAFRTSLAAWNDDPGTNVALDYTGVNNAGGGLAKSDGLNTLLFDDPYRNDPGEAVEGTFSCAEGGVIAMGGPFFYSSTRTWNGRRYHEAAEGDIVTNDGTECFFRDNPRVAEEVFAHELGHTLGLGHSGSADALMYARAHDDGRGARLSADDRAAIASLYGTGGGGNSGGSARGLASPRRLTARAQSPSSVRLAWRDRATREEGYLVEMRTGRGPWTTAATLPANSTAVTVDALEPATWYSFRVRATAGGSASGASNVATVATPG